MKFKKFYSIYTLLEKVIKVSVYDYIRTFNDIHSFYKENIIEELNKSFKKSRLYFKKSKEKGINGIAGGETFPNGKIVIKVNDSFEDNFINNRKNTIKTLADVLSHELIHREQFKRIDWSNYKIDEPKTIGQYLADKHELMAWAKQITDELLLKFYFPKKALKFLHNPKKGVCDSFDTYNEIFKNNKKMHELYKYMYEYLLIDTDDYNIKTTI